MTRQGAPGGPRSVDAAAIIAVAAQLYLGGTPIDMSKLASDLGVGRATLYRRVGKHEDLLGAVLADQTERTFASIAAPRSSHGVDAVCDVLADFIDAVVRSTPLLTLIERDPVLFVRVVMGPGAVEDRSTEIVEAVIVSHLGHSLRTPSHLLARAIVRMSDATMYTHLLSGRKAEVDDLLRLIRIVLEAATHSEQ